MQRLIIPDLWIPLSGLFWSWYRIHCRRSQYFCAWMIRWYPNLAQNLKMFQNCLAMPHTTVPTTWMDTAFVLISVEYWSKLLWAENFLVFLQLYGAKLQRDWNAGQPDQYQLLCHEDSALSERTFLWIPNKECTGISFWIKSGHSQPDIFCYFRAKYRNTYKIKCYGKCSKTADLPASLPFIKL